MAVDEEGNDVSKASKWVRLAVGIVTLTVLVGGIIWGMTATFAMKPEVKAVETKVMVVKEEIKEDIDLVAQSILQTIQQDRTKSGIRFWQQQLELSYDRERRIQNELRKIPNDVYLQSELKDEQRKQQQYKQKLNKLLEY